MIAKNVTAEEMHQALDAVSAMYGNNVIWNRFEPQHTARTKKVAFTLKVKDSKGMGAHVTINRAICKHRRTPYACWHVHGHFFEALFKIAPEAVIMSKGNKITKDSGNWEDFNVGSMAYPVYASECCCCGRE